MDNDLFGLVTESCENFEKFRDKLVEDSFRLFSSGFTYDPYTLFHTTLVCHKRTPCKNWSGKLWLVKVLYGE